MSIVCDCPSPNVLTFAECGSHLNISFRFRKFNFTRKALVLFNGMPTNKKFTTFFSSTHLLITCEVKVKRHFNFCYIINDTVGGDVYWFYFIRKTCLYFVWKFYLFNDIKYTSTVFFLPPSTSRILCQRFYLIWNNQQCKHAQCHPLHPRNWHFRFDFSYKVCLC